MLLKEPKEISKCVYQYARHSPKNTYCTQGSKFGRSAIMGKQAEA